MPDPGNRGIRAVAELLRQQYVSEYETDAPVEDWFPQAVELVNAYLEAEGQRPRGQSQWAGSWRSPYAR